MLKKSTTLIFVLLISSSILIGKNLDQDKRQLVLMKGVRDSVFLFGKWNENGGTETHLKYLGDVLTKKGMKLKIMTSVYYWGMSHHATSRILIFNGKNQYLGNYYLGAPADLPEKLYNGQLIITNKNRQDCKPNQASSINMTNGIPKSFFLKCSNGYGDIYSFSAE